MKGDFSKWSFDPADNFTGVLEQQGRVRIDQDGNAATQIVNHLRTTLVQDAIGTGVAGVPESMPDGFKVTKARIDGSVVKVEFKTGRVWADGIPLIRPGSNNSEMIAEYIGPPPATSISAGTRDAVVLEVWEEAVNAFQYPDLRETALDGVDTGERIKVFYSLRLLRLDNNQDCDDVTDLLAVESSKGRLSVKPADETIIDGDCPVEAGGGYSGFGHFLYRIEIAEPDAEGNARFKWSSFNGGLVGNGKYTPTPGALNKGSLEVSANDQMINRCGLSEFYFESLTFDPSRGRWAVAMTADATLSENGKLSLTNVDNFGTIGEEEVFFQLWNGIELIKHFPEDAKKELNDGMLLEFDDPVIDNTNYLPGDYWTFPVRAAGVSFDLSALPSNAEPQGVQYHRVPLAILNWTSHTASLTAPIGIQDCREEFPQLVNVHKGCCKDVAPDEDLYAAVQKVKKAGGGCVCLLPGVHTLTRPIDLSGQSGICIKGFGAVSQLHIPFWVNTAAFNLKNAHHICFDGFAVLSDSNAPVWGCSQTTDLTLANLFVKGKQVVIISSGGADSRWLVENSIFIAPSGLRGQQSSVYQSMFRNNFWLGVDAGIDLQNLMEVAIEYNYFLGISEADLKESLGLTPEDNLSEELTRQNIFHSLLQLLAQQSSRSVSTHYNAVDLSGGFDLTITGSRMLGGQGLGCEILENAKITNNDFLTTESGASCGIVRNLIFSENRIGSHMPDNPQEAVICKVGLRVIADVSDCRVLYNSFDNVKEGIVFESDPDGGKGIIRDLSDNGTEFVVALKNAKDRTQKFKNKQVVSSSTYFAISKCERIRIEGNHFRAGKLAIEWSGLKDVVDFRIIDNAINGCRWQPAIKIEPDDTIKLVTDQVDTNVRLIEKNRFDIFGVAVRSTLGGVRIENNDIRVRTPTKTGVTNGDIIKAVENWFTDPAWAEANEKSDYSVGRMIFKNIMSKAKNNTNVINIEAGTTAINMLLEEIGPYEKDPPLADNLKLVKKLAAAQEFTLLLNFMWEVFLAASVNQEGFAVNLGGAQNRVVGNTIYSDNADIESGIIFHLLSGEARENNILVQRIGIAMNAKAGQEAQNVRITGNTLRVMGPQSSGGASEIAYALYIPTLKPGNLAILDNYFEGSVMVCAEPFASSGLKGREYGKLVKGFLTQNTIIPEGGSFNPNNKDIEIVKPIVDGPAANGLFNSWDDAPHKNRPMVQFADNRVVRGLVGIAQSPAGAICSIETRIPPATKAMVLTLTGNTFDYGAWVSGYDLILIGNYSQIPIQFRADHTPELSPNIPEPQKICGGGI